MSLIDGFRLQKGIRSPKQKEIVLAANDLIWDAVEALGLPTQEKSEYILQVLEDLKFLNWVSLTTANHPVDEPTDT